MAGIYLHIPFCKQACNYCNFHFTTSLRYKDELICGLIKEIEAEKDYLKGEMVNTIYFGGGTPSLLEAKECIELIKSLRNNFSLARDIEITLEANPDDITSDRLQYWKDAGVNRLSIGIQSFFGEELKWMNRAHNEFQAIESVLQSQKAGFQNITIDLIYGSPLLTDEMWYQNVRKALELGVPHISCYALTVEEKTPLFKLIQKEIKANVDPDKQARQFLLLMEWLGNKNYEHYEVSNFALKGFRSRHNSSYWQGEKYLGIGPSAHSFNGSERRWNVPNNALYINQDIETLSKREFEILTNTQKLNEYIMISLRTIEGMDMHYISKHWGTETRNRLEKKLVNYLHRSLVKMDKGIASLTNEGLLLADGIASNLFEVNRDDKDIDG